MKFERWRWDAEAAQGLRLAVARDGAYIAEEVLNGISTLWRINDGQAWLVTRGEGLELVVVCLEGHGASEIIPLVVKQARKAGFKSMRAHIRRLGLLRMFRALGVERRETVIGLDL